MKPAAIQFLKRSSFRLQWKLREVHKVIQFKDGCVYRTRALGYIICEPEYVHHLNSKPGVITLGSVSTSVSRQLL